MQKSIPFYLIILPFFILISLLVMNVRIFGAASSLASNQLALLVSGLAAIAIGLRFNYGWKSIERIIIKNIASSMKAILILLFIGALTGSWLISGVIPTMIYYGLNIVNPQFFLVTSCIICAAISFFIGSSWSTIGTIGIVFLAIGKVLGFQEGLICGTIISGAYFGDKISPFSDTTLLASAVTKTDIFPHIRYMLYTSIPSFVISLLIFLVFGLNNASISPLGNLNEIQQAILKSFHIHPVLFIVPLLTIFFIIRKMDTLIVFFLSSLIGGLSTLVFQPQILSKLSDGTSSDFLNAYRIIVESMISGVHMNSDHPTVTQLLSSEGMKGMLNTIWLILSAMFFSGAMEGANILHQISHKFFMTVKSRFGLIFSTVSTCVFFNMTASDQYLSIIIPGKIFRKSYDDKNLASENLSRTLEDSGTVTSVLIPWNSCGASQSSILGVTTMVYLPFCFFNWISPIMTLIFAIFSINIKFKKENKI